MNLLLFSQVLEPSFVKTFEDFFNVPIKGLKVAYVPNARDLSIPEKRKHATENRIRMEKLGFDVEEINLLKITGDNLLKKLEDKDVIWFQGGYVSNLVKAIDSSGLRGHIKDFLENGLKYVGSSAGSLVLAKSLDSATWYPGGEDPEANKLQGLGLVDFQIIPHYKEEFVVAVEKNAVPGEKYYLLTDNQAIGIRDSETVFYGEPIKSYP